MSKTFTIDTFIEQEERESASAKSALTRMTLCFRPLTTILTCVILTILISIPCFILITNCSPDSITYQVSLAILTRVVASGLVSIAIEMANNYRRNYQRLLVLHEYLLSIALYREHMDSIQDCGIDEDRIAIADLPVRDMTVAEYILEIGPIIEAAYKDGKEYMSLDEIKYVIKSIEAAERIGDIAKNYASERLEGEGSFYEHLNPEFKTELREFAKDVGIAVVDDELRDVVADYILSNPDKLDDESRKKLKEALKDFDKSICTLIRFIDKDSGYYKALIPWRVTAKRIEREFKKQDKKFYDERIPMPQMAVKEGRITEAEYEEFLEIDGSSRKLPDFDYHEVYDQIKDPADPSEWDAADAIVDERIKRDVERNSDEWHEKLLRGQEILDKAFKTTTL